MKIGISIVMGAIVLGCLGFVRVWPHTSLFGTDFINTFEQLGGCREGDVQLCDYDPFE